jgi:hypothetical protein
MPGILIPDPLDTVRYAVNLCKKHTGELGFVPAFRYAEAHAAGRLRPQYYNGEPCGYLLHGPIRAGRPIHVWQCVIQVDARRLANATELVAGLILDGQEANATRILLRCAADLPANAFWIACGFDLLRTFDPRNTRGRLINLYNLELTPKSQLILF